MEGLTVSFCALSSFPLSCHVYSIHSTPLKVPDPRIQRAPEADPHVALLSLPFRYVDLSRALRTSSLNAEGDYSHPLRVSTLPPSLLVSPLTELSFPISDLTSLAVDFAPSTCIALFHPYHQ